MGWVTLVQVSSAQPSSWHLYLIVIDSDMAAFIHVPISISPPEGIMITSREFVCWLVRSFVALTDFSNAGVKAGRVHLCRVAGVIPYGKWRPVAVRWVPINSQVRFPRNLTQIISIRSESHC